LTVRQYVIRRLLLIPVTILLVSIFFFAMLRAIPGDTVSALFAEPGGFISEDGVRLIREELGLDRPVHIQYLDYMWHMIRGDLGYSYAFRRPVTDVLRQRLPRTAQLMGMALVGGLLIGIPLGVLSAYKQDSLLDNGARIFAVTGLTLPVFVVAALLLSMLVRVFDWMPSLDYVGPHEDFIGNMKIMIWPAMVLIFGEAAPFTRLTRSQMLEVIREDYIRTARSKGLGERVVILRHALRNAMLPIITVAGLNLSRLMAGALITEVVFEVRGMGSAMVQAAELLDYVLLQSLVIITALTILVINLLTDLTYSWIDPRIRYA
jgi:peptide/nickel transport system permease protein